MFVYVALIAVKATNKPRDRAAALRKHGKDRFTSNDERITVEGRVCVCV